MYYGCINTFDWCGWKGNGTEGEHFHRIIFSVCVSFLFCFVLRLFFLFSFVANSRKPTLCAHFVTILDSTIDRQCGSYCCCVDAFLCVEIFVAIFCSVGVAAAAVVLAVTQLDGRSIGRRGTT